MKTFADLSSEEQKEFIDLFYDRFAGRLDTYAIRVEFGENVAYMPSTYKAEEAEKVWVEQKIAKIVDKIGTPEFTERSIRAHLEGKELLGVYPIRPDNTVTWFALDFDGKGGDPFVEARDQALTLLLEAGLKVYIERSQSGNGAHVWGFLDGAVDAGKLRHALRPFIEKTETYDRMFPNQDSLQETRKLGNLIALPFAGSRVPKGNSTFVFKNGAGEMQPFADPLKFLNEIKLNPVSKIEALFEAAGEYKPERDHTKYAGDPEGLADFHKVTHPIFGCEFVRWCYDNPDDLTEPLWYALACNFAQLANGRDLFHEWSARDKRRYNPDATDKKYDQAVKANKPHSCEIIRANGGNCVCDQRFPGQVYHPFDLAKLPLITLLESVQLPDEAVTTSIAEGLDEVLEWLEAVQKDPSLGRGLTTGIKSIDRTFGFRMGELTTLAARNSIGKTALGLQWALWLAKELGVPSKFYSLEMTARQVWTRVLSPISGVTQTRMATAQMTSEDWKKVRAAKEEVQEVPFYVDDKTSHLDSILESAARFVAQMNLAGYPKAVVMIDYLQIIPRLPRENEQDAIARAITAAKRFAKLMDCHVVMLCQLNRGADDATTESKTYDAWLRGSGVIEFVSDNIIIILGEKGPGVVERSCTIHKQKNGEAGITLTLEFNQPIMKFDDAGSNRISQPQPKIRKNEGAPRVDQEVEYTENRETSEPSFDDVIADALGTAPDASADDLLEGL